MSRGEATEVSYQLCKVDVLSEQSCQNCVEASGVDSPGVKPAAHPDTPQGASWRLAAAPVPYTVHDKTTFEGRIAVAWQLVPRVEAQADHRAVDKRCPVCHGRFHTQGPTRCGAPSPWHTVEYTMGA